MFKGPSYLLRGLSLLLRPGIRLYVIIPLLINITVFVGAIWLGINQFGELIDWLMEKLPEWLQWLSWILYIVFGLVILLVVFFTFSMVANIIAAPFNEHLSNAVIKHLTGQPSPEATANGNMLSQAGKAITDELKKFAYYLIWAIPLLILFIIPVVNIAAPFIWFVFSAWMLAREYLDYPMGNFNMKFADQKTELAKQKMLGLGFGSGVSLLTMIPVANFLVMPAAVAGASALFVNEIRTNGESAENA